MHTRKRGENAEDPVKKTENFFKKNKKVLLMTKHVLNRQKERGIDNNMLYNLIFENRSKYLLKQRKPQDESNNKEQLIILNGIIDEQTFRVITTNSDNDISIITTYWVSKPSSASTSSSAYSNTPQD